MHRSAARRLDPAISSDVSGANAAEGVPTFVAASLIYLATDEHGFLTDCFGVEAALCEARAACDLWLFFSCKKDIKGGTSLFQSDRAALYN